MNDLSHMSSCLSRACPSPQSISENAGCCIQASSISPWWLRRGQGPSGACPSCGQNAVSPSWHSPCKRASPQRLACGLHRPSLLGCGQQKLVYAGLGQGLSFWSPRWWGQGHGAAGTWGGNPRGQDPALVQRFLDLTEPPGTPQSCSPKPCP